jgi:hypothetical protein
MPLTDGYESEKFLGKITDEISEGITEVFTDLDVVETFGFVLLVVDFKHGLMQYQSDLQRERAIQAVRAWLNRQENSSESN